MSKEPSQILAECIDCATKKYVFDRYIDRSRCSCGGKLKRAKSAKSKGDKE